MEITSFEKCDKTKSFRVYVDGEFCFSLPEELFLSLGLYDKKEITEDEIYNIKEIAAFKNAKSAAVKFAALKLRTEKEVRGKLEGLGFDDEVADRVISELITLGYLNDSVYAEKFILERFKLKPVSKRLLKFELENHGISPVLIDKAIEESSMDEESIIDSIIKKRFVKHDLNNEKTIKKLKSFLYARGFDLSSIEEGLRRARDRDNEV